MFHLEFPRGAHAAFHRHPWLRPSSGANLLPHLWRCTSSLPHRTQPKKHIILHRPHTFPPQLHTLGLRSPHRCTFSPPTTAPPPPQTPSPTFRITPHTRKCTFSCLIVGPLLLPARHPRLSVHTHEEPGPERPKPDQSSDQDQVLLPIRSMLLPNSTSLCLLHLQRHPLHPPWMLARLVPHRHHVESASSPTLRPHQHSRPFLQRTVSLSSTCSQSELVRRWHQEIECWNAAPLLLVHSASAGSRLSTVPLRGTLQQGTLWLWMANSFLQFRDQSSASVTDSLSLTVVGPGRDGS
mmetsp:Transcript_62573/g.111529  ORF Transcript_62573/g.111529 Transcript_62573/m.111529 type:complete len:295 (-) Transcript_62573:392-1276(-)